MRRNLLTEAVRRRLERLPPPFEAHYGVVPLPPVEEPLNVRAAAPAHAEAQKALLAANRLAASLPGHFPLSRVLLRQEAVDSSSLEGTHSTLDAVLEAEEESDDDGIDAPTTQVRDYALALEHALPLIEREARAGFSLELIQDLHRAVMAADPDYKDEPGRLRSRVVWIGGRAIEHSDFNPPPPERVGPCLQDHVAYLRTDGMQQVQQSVIARTAVAHAHFEAVHPFRDGNGRLGRLLIPLILAADGHAPLYLSPYINANKAPYMEGLRAAQQRLDHGPLVQLISEAIIASVKEAGQTIDALHRLRDVWSARRRFRKGSAAAQALDLLAAYPVITVRRMARLLGVTYAAANAGAAQLLEAGILTEHTGHRRNRVFVAREALGVFNRPFGDAPETPLA
jgi:Fic family protein